MDPVSLSTSLAKATQDEPSALVRRRAAADMELMPPPPPAKRIKRPKRVLDEDTYTEALSHIIARDFFPGLLESETQQEYLDALESKDEEWIASATRRLQQVQAAASHPGRTPRRPLRPRAAPGQTPVGSSVGGTPVSIAPSEAGTTRGQSDSGADVDTTLSLAAFQAKYTSEDNESFYKLLDRQNQKRVEKYAWLWSGNKVPSRQQLEQKRVEAKLLASRGTLRDDGFKRDRLAIRDQDHADRPAVPDQWGFQAKNQLMFLPDGVEGIETVAERAERESRAGRKEIVYANTRAPNPAGENKKDQGQRASSPSLSDIRHAIAGNRRACDAESSQGFSATGGETPRVNGYAFVDDQDPEPEAPPRKKKEMLPLIDLGPGDATPNPFQLQEQGKREALHHRMVERILQNKRTSARLGITGKVERTPVPKFPSSPAVASAAGGGLTPAAQRLWGKIGNRPDMVDSPFGRDTGKMTPRATPRKAATGSGAADKGTLREAAKGRLELGGKK